jgi:hypothetical protein
MEIATVIVTALAIGAATGIKSVAEQAVRDGYEALKTLFKTKYPKIDIVSLEQKPNSESRREVVKEDIIDAHVDRDMEIIEKVDILLKKIEALPNEALPAIGVNLENIKGVSLIIEDIIATGAGVNVKSGEFQGDITIKKVHAGNKENNDPKV